MQGLNKKRNSSIELLKIFAIFLIVISHVIHTLHSKNDAMLHDDYIIDLTLATTNIQYLILSILRYCGTWGNTIFFVCSAWFLLDRNKFDVHKWIRILVEIWSVSITITVVLCLNWKNQPLEYKDIIKSVFPTLFSNNWYMTCYIVFLPLSTYLNKIINGSSQKELLRIVMALSVIYLGISFIKATFEYSSIVLWITIYCIIAYMKEYLTNISASKKYNYIILTIGLSCHIAIILITNFIGLKVPMLKNQVLRWDRNNNPFIVMSAIALFNLFRTNHFNNSFINRVSSLSLLIYITHENLLIRNYYRPVIIDALYHQFGYDHVIIIMLLLSVGIMIFFTLISFIYEKIFGKAIIRTSEYIYKVSSKLCLWAENKIMKVN